jgi:hypothetical protein
MGFLADYSQQFCISSPSFSLKAAAIVPVFPYSSDLPARLAARNNIYLLHCFFIISIYVFM